MDNKEALQQYRANLIESKQMLSDIEKESSISFIESLGRQYDSNEMEKKDERKTKTIREAQCSHEKYST